MSAALDRALERWNDTQVPDVKPGPYYVTAQDADHYWLMRGPFDTHEEALDAVRETMNKAIDLDARAHWKQWGTARLDPAVRPTEGKMNRFFQEVAA
jgi:hypothetical protein